VRRDAPYVDRDAHFSEASCELSTASDRLLCRGVSISHPVGFPVDLDRCPLNRHEARFDRHGQPGDCQNHDDPERTRSQTCFGPADAALVTP